MATPFRGLQVLTVTSFLALSGCGTYVPQIHEIWDAPGPDSSPLITVDGELEHKIKQKVYCEIVQAVNDNLENLPRKWGVQITLDLQVDETGALNPGASFIKPLNAGQTFTLGVGATVSTQGTREDKFGSYWELDRLRGYNGGSCKQNQSKWHGSSLLLESELGISQWLTDHLEAEVLIPSTPLSNKGDPSFKQDVLTYHVKFIVISSGNITPTWKLIRVASGNGSLSLASAGRTRTHDMLITFGPAFKPGTPNIAQSAHTASEIGNAISNNRTLPSQ